MSLFSPKGATNATQNLELLGYQTQTSIYGTPIPKLWGTRRIAPNLLWTGSWVAKPVNQSGGKFGKSGGAGGKGSSNNQQYDYSMACAMGLCAGGGNLPVQQLRDIWINQSHLTLATSVEPLTIPAGGGTYTPVNVATIQYALGAGGFLVETITVTDYGNPSGSATITETVTIPLVNVAYPGPPGPGQWMINPSTGVVTFGSTGTGSSMPATFSYTWGQPTTAGETIPSSDLSLILFTGAIGQSVWSYLTSNFPAQAIAYSGLAYCASSSLDLGSAGMLPNYSMEVIGPRTFGGAFPYDCDLSLAAVDIMEECGVPSGNIGPMTQMHTYSLANGLFGSMCADTQQTAATWVNELAQITNCSFFESEGLIKVGCYGDTSAIGNGAQYTPATAPIYDLDDDDFVAQSDGPVKITRSAMSDRYNAVQVEWCNRGNAYNYETLEAKDDSAINQWGVRLKDPTELHSITQQSVAALVADAMVKREVYVPDAPYEFTLPKHFILLDPMDLVNITEGYYGFTNLPVRITKIEEDDTGDLKITAEDFPWGTAQPALHPKQVTAIFGPSRLSDPGNVATPLFFELPPAMVNNPLVIPLVIGLCGGPNWGGCNVWMSSDGSSYGKNPLYVQQGPSTMGVLTANLPSHADPDTTNTLSVDLTISLGALSSYSSTQWNNYAGLMLIDSELIAWETATLTSTYGYNLTTLHRGVYGTPVSEHLSGATCCVINSSMFQVDFGEPDVGQVRYFKFQSFNLFGQMAQTISSLTAFPWYIENPRPPDPWKPYSQAPINNDARYAQSEFSFACAVEYALTANGTQETLLQVSGNPPVTVTSPTLGVPGVQAVGTSSSGGSIPGGQTIVMVVVAIDSNGLPSARSQLITVVIPSGSGYEINTGTITWPANTASGMVFAGNTEAQLCWQANCATPTSVTITALNVDTFGPPDPDFNHFEAVLGEIISVDVFGDSVVIGSGTIQFPGYNFSSVISSLDGRFLTLAGRPNYDGPLPLASYQITGLVGGHNDTFTVTPDPSLTGGLQTGDAVGMPMYANIASSTTIGDSALALGFTPSSIMTANGNVTNAIAYIYRGPGAGQWAKVVSNTTDSWAIDPSTPWPVTPTSASQFVILTSNIQLQEFNVAPNSALTAQVLAAFNVALHNWVESAWFVLIRTIDGNGNKSLDAHNPNRVFYVFGAGGTRTIIVPAGGGTYQQLPTDGQVYFDTSAAAASAVFLLLPGSQTPNQEIIVGKESATANSNQVYCDASAGDYFPLNQAGQYQVTVSGSTVTGTGFTPQMNGATVTFNGVNNYIFTYVSPTSGTIVAA